MCSGHAGSGWSSSLVMFVFLIIISLLYIRTHNTSGYCFNPPPPSIDKNTRGICSFSKTSGVAHGAVGVLMYQILTKERHSAGELAIMFSVPFDYVWFENWFALGIFEGTISCDYSLYRQMYYDIGSFTRGRGSGSIIKYTGRAALLKGTMSAGGQSVMKVEFQDEPVGINDFNL